MKRKLSFIVAVIILLSLTGCTDLKKEEKDNKINIISTIFPSYDFARQICTDKANVTMLVPPGTESHSYEPTPKDIIALQNCDLFIYTGGVSDSWIEKILSSLDEPINILKMTDCVNTLEEEIKEGMQGEEHSDEKEYDEHVWTYPENAIKITEEIYKKVIEIDKGNKECYESNKDKYIKELQKLDNDFESLFENKKITLIFGDRFPFRYFVDGYGIDYYGAFPGCSSETEPSASTIAFLIDKIKQEKISTIFYIEHSNQKVCNSISAQTEVKTALLHSCHNVSKQEQEKGVTYLSLMQNNYETLRNAI